ncbi:hypothetical protein MTBUT4_880005 [Magnetospirillum sp. UT-4]|nr:hypothetical protein MTBUT4_880005 [Magnetospirillum sp. UT-4]
MIKATFGWPFSCAMRRSAPIRDHFFLVAYLAAQVLDFAGAGLARCVA